MKFKKAVLVNIADTHFDEKYWQQIDQLVESRVSLQRDDPKFLEELKDCDVLMLGFQVPIARDVFDAAPNLKLVNILATAYGTVDLEAATERGIPVCNLGGYSTESVAEFVIAALLTQIRSIPEGLKRAGAEDYSFAGIRARELKGSNFGVIGLGNIGNRVAELAAGFGANVSYWSRNQKDVPFAYQTLDDLLANNSFIAVCVAESEETTGMLNASNLDKIQSDSVLISIVPPPVIDTDALATRLAKGDMTFIFDHPDEMVEAERKKLTTQENVVSYPAIAFLSDEARIAKQEIFIGNTRAFLDGGTQNKVN